MRIHRIFTEQGLEPGLNAVLTGEQAHYLSRVLRADVGQQVVLFNGDGADYTAEISHIDRKVVGLAVQSKLPARSESPLHITLVQAVSRGERMDFTLQKATELGVAAFQPVFTRRTELRLKPDKLASRQEHWRKIIISACAQSGRAVVPMLHPATDVLTWARRESGAQRYVLDPDADHGLTSISPQPMVELLIGPEGGFDASELGFLGQHNVQGLSLGPRILRTETAGLAAVAIVQALAGDLG